MYKKTKIICTIGPSSESEEGIRALIEEGMDVARINFSHCPYEEALARLEKLHRIRKELDKPLAVMLDTKGPEVRIGGFANNLELKAGTILIIESAPEGKALNELCHADPMHLFTNLPGIGRLCDIGGKILLQDGFVECRVTERKHGIPNQISVVVQNNCMLRKNAHLSIPGAEYPIPFLSEKDKADIIFGVKNNFEYIALSFVRSAHDVNLVKHLVKQTDPNSQIRLISKIEDRKALEHLSEIISVSDGVMVARGDLGVEVPIELLPGIQKDIIQKCYLSGIPVIVATQMLESMTTEPYPTRAEVTDVANAVYDSTSAVMLSGETANGVHPARVVDMMRRIIRESEAVINYKKKVRANRDYLERDNFTNIMAYSAITTAHECKAKAIIVITGGGHTARCMSKFRSYIPIHAFTFDNIVRHQLALSWGVTAHLLEIDNNSMESMLKKIMELCELRSIAAPGERVVIVTAMPLIEGHAPNVIQVERVGSSYFSS